MPDDDTDIYEKEVQEEAEESDEIDELEQGFMKGYEDRHMAQCAQCGKVLMDYDDVIEIELDEETYRFCCEECAEKFEKAREK